MVKNISYPLWFFWEVGSKLRLDDSLSTIVDILGILTHNSLHVHDSHILRAKPWVRRLCIRHRFQFEISNNGKSSERSGEIISKVSLISGSYEHSTNWTQTEGAGLSLMSCPLLHTFFVIITDKVTERARSRIIISYTITVYSSFVIVSNIVSWKNSKVILFFYHYQVYLLILMNFYVFLCYINHPKTMQKYICQRRIVDKYLDRLLLDVFSKSVWAGHKRTDPKSLCTKIAESLLNSLLEKLQLKGILIMRNSSTQLHPSPL